MIFFFFTNFFFFEKKFITFFFFNGRKVTCEKKIIFSIFFCLDWLEKKNFYSRFVS